MQNATKYFFELLQISVGRRKFLSGTPDEKEWKFMFRTARKQALIGVFTDAIYDIPEEMQPPQKALTRLRSRCCMIEDANRRLFGKCCDLTEILAADGFASCILKGQGIALLHSKPLLRQCGDIDVWMKPLRPPCSASPEDIIYNYAHEKSEIIDAVYHHVGISFTIERNEDGTLAIRKNDKKIDTVEMHFRPSFMFSPKYNRRLQEWFDTQWPLMQRHPVTVDASLLDPQRTEGSRTFYCPTPDFNVIHILIHIYRHLFDEGIGLRQLLDYYYALTAFNSRADDALRSRTISTLHHLGLYNFARTVMYVLHEVFALPEEEMLVSQNTKTGRFLLGEIMRSGNFGKYDDRVNIKANEKPLHKFVRRWLYSLRLIRYFPDEVLWLPYYKLWHRRWRLRRGWIKSWKED